MKVEIKSYCIGKTYFAWCENPGKIKGIITMSGTTPEIAKEKLQLCLENKPYRHLEKTNYGL